VGVEQQPLQPRLEAALCPHGWGRRWGVPRVQGPHFRVRQRAQREGHPGRVRL
jgi:hypothetical protein